MTQANVLAQLGSPGISTGFKNRIINGAMTIDQRNAGASVIVDGYCLDRWLTGYAGSTSGQITVQQSSDTPTGAGFTNSLSLTVTTADSSFAAEGYYLQQAIEGYNCSDFKWGTAAAKTVTISFWVKASVTGAYPFIIENSAGTEVYGTTYTISSANTWEYKTLTVPGDTTGTWLTTNGSGVRVIFGLGGGASRYADVGWATKSALTYTSLSGAVNFVATSGATLYLTGVQLEVGTSATDFEYRPYGTELALCQRYYWKLVNKEIIYFANAWQFDSTSMYSIIQYPVQMRTTPTLAAASGSGIYTFYRGGSSDPFNSLSLVYAGNMCGAIRNTTEISGTAGQAGGILASDTAADVAFTAEL